MDQIFSQLLQFVQLGIGAIFRFVQLVWTWSVDQIVRVAQSPWQSWPLWKQLLLVLIAAGVIWALLRVARELREAGEKVLAAFAALLGVLVRTLPSIAVAGLVALGGLWLLNNFDPSAVRLPGRTEHTSR